MSIWPEKRKWIFGHGTSSVHISSTTHDSRWTNLKYLRQCRSSGWQGNQGHFRSIWLLPLSLYSWLLIHICWNVPMEAKIEPPIQAPNRRSADPLADIIFSRILLGIRTLKSRFNLSGNPYNKIKINFSSTDLKRGIFATLLIFDKIQGHRKKFDVYLTLIQIGQILHESTCHRNW